MSFGFFNPTGSPIPQIYYATGIDAKTVANTLILTTANEGKDFLVTRVWLYYTTVSGFSSGPFVNVGTNSTAYDNVVTSGSLGVLSGTGNAADQQLNNDTPAVIPANTAIYCRIATGGAGTTLTMTCLIEGHYLP